MFKINNNAIAITRGDSAYVSLALTDQDGNTYTPSEKDIIEIQVRENPESSEVLFNAIIPHNTLIWHIKPDDTQNAEMGKTYYYDCQITLENGDVFTAITCTKFKILKEVTR